MSDWSLYFQALEESEFSISFMFPVIIIVVMALVAVNLFVAAIAFGFSRVMADENNKHKEAEAKLAASSAVAPSEIQDVDGTQPESIQCDAPAEEVVLAEESGCCFKLRACLRSATAERIVMSIVILNSALMSSHHASMSELHKTVMWYGEMGFTSFFCAEVLLKLTVFGTEYFKDNWNVFDSVVAFCSLIDLLLESVNVSQMRLLRLFRALRTSRFLRSLKSVRKILAAMSSSAHMVGWVFAILLCVQFVFALVTHQLFANKLDKYDPVPRATFDTILSSCLCLCQCITGDSWEIIMFNAMDDQNTGWAAAPCFIGAYIIANFLIINLLIASILDAISASTIETDDDELEEDEEAIDDKESKQASNGESEFDGEVKIAQNGKSAESLGDIQEQEVGDASTTSCCQSEHALWMFHKDSCFRVHMQLISASSVYQIFFCVNVLASTGILVLDTKKNSTGLYNSDAFKTAEEWSTLYFTAVFTIDLLLQSIAHGLFCKSGPTIPYFRHSVFNKLDFTALVLLYVDLVTYSIWDSSSLFRVPRSFSLFPCQRLII